MEKLSDPLNNRVIREILPPPHQPLHHSILFPKTNVPDWKILK